LTKNSATWDDPAFLALVIKSIGQYAFLDKEGRLN